MTPDNSMPENSSAAAGALDPENPWLGLFSYTEQTRAYFHGRDDEAAAVVAHELGHRSTRWERDLGSLLPEPQHRLSRMLLDYYFQNVLRTEPAKRDRYCRAG